MQQQQQQQQLFKPAMAHNAVTGHVPALHTACARRLPRPPLSHPAQLKQPRSKPPTTMRFRCSSVAMRSVKGRPSALWCVTNGRASAPPATDSSTGVSTCNSTTRRPGAARQRPALTCWHIHTRMCAYQPGALHLLTSLCLDLAACQANFAHPSSAWLCSSCSLPTPTQAC